MLAHTALPGTQTVHRVVGHNCASGGRTQQQTLPLQDPTANPLWTIGASFQLGEQTSALISCVDLARFSGTPCTLGQDSLAVRQPDGAGNHKHTLEADYATYELEHMGLEQMLLAHLVF